MFGHRNKKKKLKLQTSNQDETLLITLITNW